MKKILNSLLIFLCAFTATAQSTSIPRPKLVIGIVVDQMRWDYLYRYYGRYSNKGFKRLLSNGFACQNTYLNYIPSYTAPGHTTIYSGTVPAVHGIVGNDWVDGPTGKNRYCAQDDSVHGVGGSQIAGKMSPQQMKSSNIGDELRLASNFRSRVFGIALKDRGAIFPSGHLSNGAYWFDDSTGNFMTSSYYTAQLPLWLQKFNARRWADTLLATKWETLYPIESYTQSIADNNEYEQLRKGEQTPSFPHLTEAKNYKNIRSLPAGNTLTFKLAKALINAESMGQSLETDMLTISLSSTDYIGHAYAPNSIEVEDTYLRLDRDLAGFLGYLDERIGAGNYLLFLSADHGAAHNAKFLEDRNVPAGVLSEYNMKPELNKQMKLSFGADSLIRAVMNYQVVLDEERIKRNNIDRELLKAAIIAQCRQHPGMAYVLDIEHLYKSPVPEFIKEPLRNGYYATRCGSIALIYEPGWYSDGLKGTTHGTWNPYDTHIPLLWYGWHIPTGESFQKTSVTDIAATLAALLHIQVPNGANGSVLFAE